jgi:alkylation response protein AidB-like acyl-CoA dehydrogenase
MSTDLPIAAAGAGPAAAPAARPGAFPAAGSPERAALLAAIAADARDRSPDDHPTAGYDLVRGAGLGAARLPVADGGADLGVRDLFAFLVELAAADPDLAHGLRSHHWFVEQRLLGAAADRARWLPEIAAGRLFGNAVTERGTGDAVGANVYRTTLVPDGDGFRLDGLKHYTTGSLYADRVGVLAATPGGGLANAVVPVGRAGVEIEDDWDGFGQRRTGSGTTRLTAVRVKADEVIAEEWAGEDPPPTYEFAYVQLWLQAVQAGIARAVLRDAVALVRGRGRTYSHGAADTAAEDPVLQTVVGTIAAQAFAAESIVLGAADALADAVASAAAAPDRRPERELADRASLRAAQAKVVVDELAPRVATLLFDVGGASAVSATRGLDRHWRNVRTLASHNPTPYKARAIGDALVNERRLPSNGFF